MDLLCGCTAVRRWGYVGAQISVARGGRKWKRRRRRPAIYGNLFGSIAGMYRTMGPTVQWHTALVRYLQYKVTISPATPIILNESALYPSANSNIFAHFLFNLL